MADGRLTSAPCPAFGAISDPTVLYPAHGHLAALTALDEGIAANTPFMLLTGESGAGKTLLLNTIESKYLATRTIGWIRLNEVTLGPTEDAPAEAGAEIDSDEFIASIEMLLEEAAELGQPALLIVDDAHLLTAQDLADLRQLQRPRQDGTPLVLLLAADLPTRPSGRPRPLSQDAGSTPIELAPLDPEETAAYVAHRFTRLRCDCHRGMSPFDAESLKVIHRSSGGVPGVTNQMVQRCIEEAERFGLQKITASFVESCLRPGPVYDTQILPLPQVEGAVLPTPAPITFSNSTIGQSPVPMDSTAPEPGQPVMPVTAETRSGRVAGRIFALAGVGVIAAVATVFLWQSEPTSQSISIPLSETAPDPVAAPEPIPQQPTVASVITSESAIPESRALLSEALEAGLSDSVRAAMLYERAAIWGNARAAYYLGQMFESGDGVQADANRARAWYLAAGNIPGAATRLASVEEDATPSAAPDAPVALAQTLLTDGRIELHWRSAPGSSPANFAVEYEAADADGQTQRVVTDRSAILLDGPIARWRMIALTPAGEYGGTSDWIVPQPSVD